MTHVSLHPSFSDNNSWQQNNNSDEQLPSWDNGSMFDGQYDDGYVHSDLDDSVNLVSQPRRVCLYFYYSFLTNYFSWFTGLMSY